MKHFFQVLAAMGFMLVCMIQIVGLLDSHDPMSRIVIELLFIEMLLCWIYLQGTEE